MLGPLVPDTLQLTNESKAPGGSRVTSPGRVSDAAAKVRGGDQRAPSASFTPSLDPRSHTPLAVFVP